MIKQVRIKVAQCIVNEVNSGLSDFLNDVMSQIPAPRYYMDEALGINALLAVQDGLNPFNTQTELVQLVNEVVNLSTDLFGNDPDNTAEGYVIDPCAEDPDSEYFHSSILQMECIAESEPISFTLVNYPQFLFIITIY